MRELCVLVSEACGHGGWVGLSFGVNQEVVGVEVESSELKLSWGCLGWAGWAKGEY